MRNLVTLVDSIKLIPDGLNPAKEGKDDKEND